MQFFRVGKSKAAGWLNRAVNNEPALIFSGIFATVALAVPLVVVPMTNASGKKHITFDLPIDEHPMLHRYEDHDEKPDLEDYETIMRYYRGKKEYVATAPPENSSSPGFQGTARQWWKKTNHWAPEKGKWKVPEL